MCMRLIQASLPCIAALAMLASLKTGYAQSPYAVAGITDVRQVEAFLSELQRASRDDDRKALAALFHYPTMVTISGLRIPFADASALLERADAIFTPALRSMIARAAAASGSPQPGRAPILVTENGLVVGANAVAITLVDGRLRIMAIVVPPPDSADVPPVSRSESPARRQKPRRITIRVGPRPTQVSGSLIPGVPDAFIVWVNKGQRLEVRVERAPMGAAAVRVVHAGKGTPLNPAASDTARVVSGRVLDGADYRIEVRRLDASEAAPLPYFLSVSLR